jgi:hypothetical protein
MCIFVLKRERKTVPYNTTPYLTKELRWGRKISRRQSPGTAPQK